MKKLIIGLFAFSLLISASQLANASFFDNSTEYLDASQWQQYSNSDFNHEITITDNNALNRLEFASSRTTADGNGVYNAMVSKWSLDLNHSFDLIADYHHSVLNPTGVDGFSSLDLVFYDGNANLNPLQDPDYLFLVGATSGQSGFGGHGFSKIMASQVMKTWDRSVVDGTFRAIYNAALDQLILLDVASSGGITINGLKGTYNLNSLKLALSAGSDGYPYSGDNAYFKNLKLSDYVLTPEPVSSVLFLLGGGAMAFARRRMKVSA